MDCETKFLENPPRDGQNTTRQHPLRRRSYVRCYPPTPDGLNLTLTTLLNSPNQLASLGVKKSYRHALNVPDTKFHLPSSASPFQMFSMNSFPDGHVTLIPWICETFPPVCQDSKILVGWTCWMYNLS